MVRKSTYTNKKVIWLSSQCVTLGSILWTLLLTYTPKARYPLHNLQIFLRLDPSVTHWDDMGETHLDNKCEYWIQVSTTQMTPFGLLG
ncbi:hypothetical protein [Wolbachia endosymbiont of Folsomia candida]|uniref:hypothetical protein n=1 Tax=Wolbachia endosymbiont of Folsomia candida TaxID=169402 RepID=UPI001300544C|nr:hypothetical protein [Wolbachia endosymbiont of Folsomia candida]